MCCGCVVPLFLIARRVLSIRLAIPQKAVLLSHLVGISTSLSVIILAFTIPLFFFLFNFFFPGGGWRKQLNEGGTSLCACPLCKFLMLTCDRLFCPVYLVVLKEIHYMCVTCKPIMVLVQIV